MSRKKPTPKQRETVAERAQHRCEYCQALKTYSPSPFNLEHIIPISLGGLTAMTMYIPLRLCISQNTSGGTSCSTS